MKLSGLKAASDTYEGRWFQFVPGVEFKIAKWGNPRHMAELERLALDALEKGTKRDAGHLMLAEKQAAAVGLLTDWRGLDDDDGKPLPYSPEVGFKVLSDEAYWEAWAFVKTKSQQGHRGEAEAEGN